MKQLPFYSADRHTLDAWLLNMEHEGLATSLKNEVAESEEATHQILNVTNSGEVLFWFEIAKEKPSGRHIVIFGPPPKNDALAAYESAQTLLLEAGARKLAKLT